ncbi:MAG: hypothetical protein FJZ96_02720 [Chloroflexi bacterium]|nr:hypothetical protein [Chloroflexota bacterium]
MPARIHRLFDAVGACILLISLLSGSALVVRGAGDRVRQYTRPVEFDYFDWTVDAVWGKWVQASISSPFYFEPSSRHALVADYLRLQEQILEAENRLGLIFTDPAIPDPEQASASLRLEMAGLYSRHDRLAPVAEAVLESQVNAVLAGLGLASGGQAIPPALFHITPLPYNLIVSPRDRIEQETSVSLIPDLTADRQAALETQVDSALGFSSLVVPVGGIGAYPTMVMRTTALDWLANTIAHEWIHNWLTLRPLGIRYDAGPELRTMNETTASLAGNEIGLLLIQRYYPELAAAANPGGPWKISLPPAPIDVDDLRRPFDFRAEMHTTRTTVDALLLGGMIEEAEAYMEVRRQVFWDNGYAIRKLNQAYFAFYGAYADVPGGAAGEDPVGPAVRALRDQSASLADFLHRIADMTSFEELQAAVSP